jgi:hypothetical protein
VQGKIVHGGKLNASEEESCQEKEALTVRRGKTSQRNYEKPLNRKIERLFSFQGLI